MANEPKDLSPAAIKVARRLQGLPKGRQHLFTLFKDRDRWTLCLLSGTSVVEEVRVEDAKDSS